MKLSGVERYHKISAQLSEIWKKKKNWNHTRPLESNRTISNKTTTFKISQSPKLDKIIQTPLNAAQLCWIIRKLPPLFSNLPCVATILWLINKLPGVVHDLIIVVGECPLSYWRTQLSYRRTPPSSQWSHQSEWASLSCWNFTEPNWVIGKVPEVIGEPSLGCWGTPPC